VAYTGGGGDRNVWGVGGKTRRKETKLQDLNMDGSIILQKTLKEIEPD
jgi:hypothetical protein